MSTAASPPRSEPARRFVLMGVAGSGKSTVGAALAERLGANFVDGDELHPAANIAKMRRGEPLTDADRWPWLDRVGQVIAAAEGPIVLACSALKRGYRDRIIAAAGVPVTFIHLSAGPQVIASRMAGRQGHFMPVSLIDSQFAALEEPGPSEDAVSVDAEQPLEAVIATLVAQIAR